jgi:hypothetical protein
MGKQTIAIQSFGRESEYRRAALTILSFYAHTSVPVADTLVVLFTDRPQWFESCLDSLPVRYILLTPEKIKSMRGEIDFLHRMKIALIEEAFTFCEESLLYADSDTFFTADPTPLVQQLGYSKAFMHLWEYRFESMSDLPLPAGSTFRDFLKLIETKTFRLADGTPVTIRPEQVSWNAGVMFFHHSQARFIPDVYALTDQFYPPTSNHASEQYAFSVILQEQVELQPCDSVIYHYWYRVKKQITDLFLATEITEQWKKQPLSEKVREVRRWTEMLPGYFEKHLLLVQDHAIQAFNEGRYAAGYKFAAAALLKSPLDRKFIREIFYHTKRKLSKHND